MAEDVTVTNLRVGKDSLKRDFDDVKREFTRFKSEVERMEFTVRAKGDIDPGIAKSIRGIGEATDQTNKAFDDMLTRTVRLGTALEVARRAATGLKIAADVKEFFDVLSGGNLDEIEKSKGELRKAIVATTPGSIADSINRLGLHDLVTPIPAGYSNEILKGGSTLSNEEERAARAQEAADAKKEAANEHQLEQQNKLLALARRITDETRRQAEEAGKTPAQRSLSQAQGDLAKFNEAARLSDPQIKDTVDEARKGLEANVERESRDLVSDIIGTFRKVGDKFADEFMKEADRQGKERERLQKEKERADAERIREENRIFDGLARDQDAAVRDFERNMEQGPGEDRPSRTSGQILYGSDYGNALQSAILNGGNPSDPLERIGRAGDKLGKVADKLDRMQLVGVARD